MSQSGDAAALRPGRAMALGTIASRATGFVRTAVIAAALGTALVGDAYNVANTTPNIVYELLLGGVLTAFVVPLLVRAATRDHDGGEAYAQRLLTLVVLVLTGVSIVAVVAAPWIVDAYLDAGGRPEQRDLAVVLVRYFMPQILFYGLGATVGAVLNVRGRYAAPMWAPVVNNLVVIATGLAFLAVTVGRPEPGRLSSGEQALLGVGTTAGIVAQTVVLLPALRATGFRWRLRLDFPPGELRHAISLARWAAVYVLANQAAYLVVVRLATGAAHEADDGTATGYSPYALAFQLLSLPHAIVTVSIATALLPRMSRHAEDGRPDLVRRDLSAGLRVSAAALVPAAVGTVVLGRELAVVALGHGNTSVADARYVGTVLAAFAFGLVPFAFFQQLLRASNAFHDARSPALVNLAVNAVNIVADVALYVTLPDRHRVVGLAAGWALSYFVGFALLRHRVARRTGGVDGYRLTRTVVRLLLAAMAGAAVAVLGIVGAHSALGRGGTGSAVALLLGGGAGAVTFAAVGRRMRVTELTTLRELVALRVTRSG